MAIHDSETTRALASMPATGLTPTGAGTTGYQWWLTNWNYFVMPEALQEMLRSDGTAFFVIHDSDISAGLLLPNGKPKFPIVISLASEAVQNNEIAPLLDYVSAGGYLVVGSSGFSRNPDGTSRGDIAFANQMGVHMAAATLANWTDNVSMVKQADHRLVAHLPNGPLTWRMPSAAEEISWGVSPSHQFAAPHSIWRVQVTDATVLAQGDNYPLLTIKKYGNGYFIYIANLQPLIAHGGFGPGMYAYAIFRNAIEWAYESARLPVVKLSPWPFWCDAAFLIRHDLENFANSVAHIEASAEYEYVRGLRGDYYFCTGTLREDMADFYDVNAVIASLQRAAGTYGATIAPHNGGLLNPMNMGLSRGAYDYWHWGLDEALDTTPPGYANGKAYALASLSTAFQDIEGWLPGLATSDRRVWVSPLFNSTREDSYSIQEQLAVKVAGDQKLGPFPHWTVSTRTSGKRYSILSQPVSDWYVNGMVAQSLEPWHDPGIHTSQTLHEAIDFYYNMGGLINFYSHTLSTCEGDAGALVPDYIDYCRDVSRFPKMWAANALSIYDWWVQRSAVQITSSCTTTGGEVIVNANISGASSHDTTIEFLLPASVTITNFRVFRDGAQISQKFYRVNGQVVKVNIGNASSSAQIRYDIVASAQTDTYSVGRDNVLTVAAPGVLGNDQDGGIGGLSAVLENGPTHGSLALNADGSFTYTPQPGFTGTDGFTYRAQMGQSASGPGMVIINVTAPGEVFSDDFSRPMATTDLSPWVLAQGNWVVQDGKISGASQSGTYGNVYYDNSGWTDYRVSARIQFSSTSGLGAGVGGRVNPVTGAHYAAWVYPDNSVVGGNVIKLVKFSGWSSWSGSPMAIANLPNVGTAPHLVEVTFQGANIIVRYDGTEVINVTDNNFDGLAPFTNGGISLDLYTDTPYTFAADDVSVTLLTAPPVITSQPASRAVNAGSATTFSVTAQGESLNYQWQFNGASIGGATGSSYTIANVQASDAGDYRVIVSNPAGQVTSQPATLTVTVLSPPVIVTQPQSQTVIAGQNASFSVAATGKAPLRYQWRRDLANIAGATNSTLIVSNVQSSASYSVIVSNPDGLVTSASANLSIQYTLTVTSETGGSVTVKTAQASYAPGTKVTLTADADGDYKFVGWSGDASGYTNPLTVTMNSNMTIRANFNKTLLGRILGGLL